MRIRNNSINWQKRINANQLVSAITSHKSVLGGAATSLYIMVEVVILVQIQSFFFNSFDALPSDDKSEYNVDGYLSDECREHEVSLTLLYNMLYIYYQK